MSLFDETRYPTSTRLGVASEVTLMTPIKKGRIDGEYRIYRQRLQGVLDDLAQRELAGLPTPISVIRQIHFARWVILPPPGGGDGGSLLFTSNFDGEMKFYFRNFALDLTDDIDRVWENCEGYPGARDFDRLWQYVKEHQIETTAFYDAYRALTVPQIFKLERLKGGFDKLVAQLRGAQDVAGGAQQLADELDALLQCAQSTVPLSSLDKTGQQPHAALERDDIQVNILGSPPWGQAGYYFLSIRDPRAFRDGLWRLLQRGRDIGFLAAQDFDAANLGRKAAAKSSSGAVKAATSSDLKRAVTVAFSWSGLERTGLAAEHLAGLPLAFRQGMAARAPLIGDVDGWSPDKWDGVLGQKQIHVLISVFGIEATVADDWKEITRVSRGGDDGDFAGCELMHTELGNRIGEGIEPFGFRDGIGQPEIGSGDPKRAVAAGEFILGYGDVDGNDQIAEELVGASVRALCRNGTFMVFRKIEQDVAAFETFARKHGDALALRLMGRRRDGTSLVLDAPAADEALKEGKLDDFDYRDDPTGAKCPFASHARRTNQRTDDVRRHRIIRRGIPYDQDGKKGMLFVCFNARIDTQFEFLQSEWCKKGDFLGYFTEVRDPIVGGGGSFVDPLAPVPYALRSFVTVKGGDYFFLPGLEALDGIVHGSFDMPSTTPPAAPAPADPPPETLDPVGYIEGNVSLVRDLLLSRGIAEKHITWPSGRRQALYYVACRDQVRQILADDTRFTSAQYARKIENLLAGYDHRPWLRDGEKAGPEGLVLRRALLGMPGSDGEKRARLQILKQALGASDLDDLRRNLGGAVRPVAEQAVKAIMGLPGNEQGLDVVHIAYAVPVARAMTYFGFPASSGFSDAYKALYFGRTSIDDVRRFGWLDRFPEDAKALPPELLGLVHPIAIFLLIDVYDTASALAYARVAVKELLDRLAGAVIAEEDRIAAGSPTNTTLLSRMLQVPHPGVDAATFRLRVGMTLAELLVGGIDTAAKGIANVVDCLLSNPDALRLAREAVERGDEGVLHNLALEALRCRPVAPMIVRECPTEAVLRWAVGGRQGEYRFEAASRLFLLTEPAMHDPVDAGLPGGVDLSSFVLDQSPAVQNALYPISQLNFGDGAHGCLGSEIVLAEIREVLRQLVVRKNLRRAAGPDGTMKEQYALPVSLKVRFDS